MSIATQPRMVRTVPLTGVASLFLVAALGCGGMDNGSPTSSTTTASSSSSTGSGGSGGTGPVAISFFTGDATPHAITEALFYDVVDVRIDGLAPHAQALVTTTMGAYTSAVTFEADDAGHVSSLTDAPVSGSYDGVDPDGFFWSMAAPDNSMLTTLSTHFNVQVDGAPVADADLKRDTAATDLTKTTVPTDTGLVGVLYTPSTPGPHPVIVAFGGSEGGLEYGEIYARSYASLGYTTLGLAYFDAAGLPTTLTSIPLEYFGKAFDWLKTQPAADTTQIAVLGASRGGELALLLGANFPQVKAVVAIVPSGLVWGSTASFTDPAWTLNGTPLPFVPSDPSAQPTISKMGNKTLYHFRPTFVADIAAATPDQLAAATTHVENTMGPVLMMGGDDDQLWPSCDLAKVAMDRLTAMGHATSHADDLECYPDSGHFTDPVSVGYPTTAAMYTYDPGAGGYLAVGGTAKGIGHAERASWEKTRAFLAAAFH